jgi:hypothetical protein
MSKLTPVRVIRLMQYYFIPEPPEPVSASEIDADAWLESEDLRHKHLLSDKGEALVQGILKTPMPVEVTTWEIPND